MNSKSFSVSEPCVLYIFMYNYFCQYNDSFIFLVLLALTVYTTDSRFNRSKNTFSEKSFFMMLREMIPLYLRYIKCTIGISLDFWIFEVNVVGYVMLFGADGSFLRI